MARFGKVTQTAQKVAIFGTGSSLAGVDCRLPDSVMMIAVNGAIEFLPRADAWFTLDASPINCARIEHRKPGVVYYVAGPLPYNRSDVISLRRITGESNSGYGRYLCKEGLSLDKGAINTGNSGWGALQLAVHMGAKKIALFGIDGQGDYLTGGQPRNLTMMPGLFASAVCGLKELGIEVINGSPRSLVTCFPRVTAREALEWIARD